MFNRSNRTSISDIYSRTVVLIDATGSMGDTLEAVKTTVMKMFELLLMTMSSEGIPEGAFEMMIGLYRNYNSQDLVLEHTTFSSKPEVLRSWLKDHPISGGWGREAIEVALQFVNTKLSSEFVTQVIYINLTHWIFTFVILRIAADSHYIYIYITCDNILVYVIGNPDRRCTS